MDFYEEDDVTAGFLGKNDNQFFVLAIWVSFRPYLFAINRDIKVRGNRVPKDKIIPIKVTQFEFRCLDH